MQEGEISSPRQNIGLLLDLQLVFRFLRRLQRHLSGSEVNLAISVNNQVRFHQKIFEVFQ